MPMCGPCGQGMHERCQPTSYDSLGYSTCTCLHDREWMKLSNELAACLEALNKGDVAQVKLHLIKIGFIGREL